MLILRNLEQLGYYEGVLGELSHLRDNLDARHNRIYKFNALELRRADSGVKDVADGRYDWRIDRLDRGQGGGLSR